MKKSSSRRKVHMIVAFELPKGMTRKEAEVNVWHTLREKAEGIKKSSVEVQLSKKSSS